MASNLLAMAAMTSNLLAMAFNLLAASNQQHLQHVQARQQQQHFSLNGWSAAQCGCVFAGRRSLFLSPVQTVQV